MNYQVTSGAGECLYRGADLELAWEIRDAEPTASLIPLAAALPPGGSTAMGLTAPSPGRSKAVDPAVTEACAKQRHQLSRDLHDGVGPALAGLAMQLRTVQRAGLDPAARNRLFLGMEEDLGRARAEMREILGRLRTPALDVGLRSALEREVARVAARSDLRVRLVAPDVLPTLGTELEEAIYRIASEALSNAVRHSRGDVVVVRVRANADSIELQVTDNGVGPPSAAPSRADTFGIGSMSERAAALGGHTAVEARHPRGTRVRATLPISARREVSNDVLLAPAGR